MSIDPAPSPTNVAVQDSTGPYNCEMCKILFNSEEELAIHTQVHKGAIAAKGRRCTRIQKRRKLKSKARSSASRNNTKAKSKTKASAKAKKRKVTPKNTNSKQN